MKVGLELHRLKSLKSAYYLTHGADTLPKQRTNKIRRRLSKAIIEEVCDGKQTRTERDPQRAEQE